MKFIHKDTCLFFALSLLLLLFPQSLHSENTSQKSEIFLLSTYSRLSTKGGQADETEKIIMTQKKVEDITRRENPYEEEKIASESESRKKETLNSRILSMVIVSAISIFLIIVISLQNARKKSIILAGKNQEIERQKKLLQQRNEELIKSQEQLKTANEGKDQFLTILSHDLRNPITAIRGFVELLLKQYDSFPDEKKKMFLQEILDSVERLSLLLTNVLFWTRSQTKGIKNHPQKLNLYKRIDSNISIYSLIARDKGIGMHNNIPVDINIYADKNIFDTIVRNLISNSLKFTNKGGSITFEARSTEKRIILVIKDTGIGMEKDKIKKILQLSTNTSSLGTQKEQGTGLGLTLVQDFVLVLGGEFSIKSDSGEGSEFIINLPVSENS
ncbi:MAG: sensor histidine kinase [Bacteroidota bacterium]